MSLYQVPVLILLGVLLRRWLLELRGFPVKDFADGRLDRRILEDDRMRSDKFCQGSPLMIIGHVICSGLVLFSISLRLWIAGIARLGGSEVLKGDLEKSYLVPSG
jgi:hypothetical protein